MKAIWTLLTLPPLVVVGVIVCVWAARHVIRALIPIVALAAIGAAASSFYLTTSGRQALNDAARQTTLPSRVSCFIQHARDLSPGRAHARTQPACERHAQPADEVKRSRSQIDAQRAVAQELRRRYGRVR